MSGVMQTLRGNGGRKEALADNSPASVEAVDKGSDVRLDQTRRGVEAVVSDVEGKTEVSAVLDVERREPSLGVNGGVVSNFHVREVAGPAGVGSGDATGEQEVTEGGVEALGEANSLVMSSSRSLNGDPNGGEGDSDELGQEDATAVRANSTGVAFIPNHVQKEVLEDLAGVRRTSDGNADDSSSELVSENQDVIEAIVVVANRVQVDSDNVPRVVAVACEVEFAGRHATDLGTRTSVAVAHVLLNITVKARPKVETRDGANCTVDPLMAIEIVVRVKSPGAKRVRQDNAVASGGARANVRANVQANEDAVNKAVARTGGAEGRVQGGRVGVAGGEEVGRPIEQIGVDVAELSAGALGGDDITKRGRARQDSGAGRRTARTVVEGGMRTKGGVGGRGGRRLGGKARCSGQAGGDGETDLRAEPATGDNVPAESGRGGVQAVGEGEGETAGQIKER